MEYIENLLDAAVSTEITPYTATIRLISTLARICNPCYYHARIANPREQNYFVDMTLFTLLFFGLIPYG